MDNWRHTRGFLPVQLQTFPAKPIDYSSMFSALAVLMASEKPQMELYQEIGKLVSARLEK